MTSIQAGYNSVFVTLTCLEISPENLPTKKSLLNFQTRSFYPAIRSLPDQHLLDGLFTSMQVYFPQAANWSYKCLLQGVLQGTHSGSILVFLLSLPISSWVSKQSGIHPNCFKSATENWFYRCSIRSLSSVVGQIEIWKLDNPFTIVPMEKKNPWK